MATLTIQMSLEIAAFISGRPEIIKQALDRNLPKRDGRPVVHVEFRNEFIESLVRETMTNVG